MRISKIIYFLIILLVSCNPKDKEKPNVLSREQMVDILIDIQLVEAKLAYEKISTISFEQISTKYYESVFSKYNISKEEFEESMFYYEKDIEELDNIYTDVITKLNKIQSEIINNKYTTAEHDSIYISNDEDNK